MPLIWTFVLSLAVNVLVLVPSLYLLQVFDRVLVSRSLDTLAVLLTGTVFALALLLLLDYLRTRLQGLLGQAVGDALMPAAAEHLIAGASRRAEGATAVLRDVSAVRRVFSSSGMLAVLDAPWLVVYVVLIALAHPVLGVTAALAALAMVGLAAGGSLVLRHRARQGQDDVARAQRWLEDTLRNAELTRALGLSRPLLARWAAMNERIASDPAGAAGPAWLAASTRTLRQGVQVIMLSVGAWLVVTQAASPGVMIATTILLGRALAPVEQLVAGWPTLLEGRAAWQRLSDLLANVVNPVPSVRLPAPTGRVSLQEVAFQPDADERPVLSGVSFEVEPGGSLAIIGPSGSGKSTLARLVVGVWHPTSGKVRLDRVDLAQWPRKQVGPSIGYVPQAIQLFAGTVAENIARLDAVDSKRVVEAAKRAHVHDLIVGLPQGYETRIDPQSPIVSPGQRQRIALARALYGNPRLLVLDEPNASLDGDGEAALARVLESLRGTVTVVVVTHRPQLVQHVDRMLVLEHGQVKRIGNVLEVTAAMAPSGARPGAAVLPVARLGRAAGGAR
jgi:PrtD family type I secretion system ABC transporter